MGVCTSEDKLRNGPHTLTRREEKDERQGEKGGLIKQHVH